MDNSNRIHWVQMMYKLGKISKEDHKKFILSEDINEPLPKLLDEDFVQEVSKRKQELEDLTNLAKPLMKYIADNYNPHYKIEVGINTVQILQEVKLGICNDYLD